MQYLCRRPDAETASPRYRDHVRPWPLIAKKLMSLIDLGWSDYRIATYYCVPPEKVSALRSYYGLVQHAQESWVWRMRRRNRMAYER
jgi:hypothetical protein